MDRKKCAHSTNFSISEDVETTQDHIVQKGVLTHLKTQEHHTGAWSFQCQDCGLKIRIGKNRLLSMIPDWLKNLFQAALDTEDGCRIELPPSASTGACPAPASSSPSGKPA